VLSVKLLLLTDLRVDPAARDNEPIRDASSIAHTSVVKLLLADQRVDPSMAHPTALERASGQGRIDIVQLLLEHPKVVVTTGMLLQADERHNGDIARLLIEKQPRVLQDLFEDATPCVPSGVLEKELRQREKASALTFLLVAERLEGAVRASDVLREVMVEYACFELEESDW
jgi:hypothetical protein